MLNWFKKLLIMAVAFVMTATLSGCGKDKSSDTNGEIETAIQSQISDTLSTSSDETAEIEKGETETEIIYGNLAFDFNEAVQNIYLFGQKISLPCIFKEFGEDFTLAQSDFVTSNLNPSNLAVGLLYKNERIGTVLLEDCDRADRDKESKRVYSLSVGNILYTDLSRINGWYSGGVIPMDFLGTSFYSTQDEIMKILGEPTLYDKIYDGCDFRYKFSKYEYVLISFDKDKVLTFDFFVK